MVKKSDGEIIAEGLSELAEAMEKGLADAIVESGNNISASLDSIANKIDTLAVEMGGISSIIDKLGCFGDASSDSIDVNLDGDIGVSKND